MKKLFTITSLLTIFIFYHPSKLWAHNADEKWIFINESSEIITENHIPNPSKLEWAAHVVNTQFNVGEEIKFSVSLDAIEHNLKVDSNTLSIEWLFTDGFSFQGEGFTKIFKNNGNYFLSVKIINEKDEALEEENIMIIVGERPLPTAILVNNNLNENNIYQISRLDEIIFSIVNPNDLYRYTWDLADGEIINNQIVNKRFTNTKLPAYIVLRTTDQRVNTFTDSYIRLEGSEDAEFKVVTPAVKVDNSIQTQSKRDINPILFFSLSVFVLVMGSYGIRK